MNQDFTAADKRTLRDAVRVLLRHSRYQTANEVTFAIVNLDAAARRSS